MNDRFAAAMLSLPLVAILRGIKPGEAADLGKVLVARGFTILEVPLNSPDPLLSIATLRKTLPPEIVVGAGTVIKVEDVAAVKTAGGELIVMPHCDVKVIEAARREGMAVTPGIATPTEAFAALAAGADALKLFPAEMITPPVVRALLAVLPKGAAVLPVGGITPEAMRAFVLAGAKGFGLGSALYKPGMGAAELGTRAERFAAAWRLFATAANPENNG